MSDIAIKVENLSKQYRIGKRESYRALRDTLTDVMYAPFRRLRSVFGAGPAPEEAPEETIWALKEVSFEIPRGDVVGIIGRNGAGKSTLLKILSRITDPTEGYAEIRGRVASLLEVGTGFHPELTGRENIYLNGAILGMAKAEITRKFDEIIAFAELEKFIDTPVKHYSTGMYMRLAFAVSAHLEPEILVIDEVLAVGDAAFQKKCIGKMGKVAREGRTVLFVSHSMASVASLCKSGILLNGGRVGFLGPIDKVIEEYLQSCVSIPESADFRNDRTQHGTGEVRIAEAAILDNGGTPCSTFQYGDDICVEFQLEEVRASRNQMCVVLIHTATGVPVLHLTAHDGNKRAPLRVPGTAKVRCIIPNCQLYPGSYLVSIWIGSSAYLSTDNRTDVLRFHVEQGELFGLGFELSWRHGVVHAASRWQIFSTSSVPEPVCSSAD